MTQPLLVVLPTHVGDVDQAETLVRWIKELSNVSDHSLLIAADAGIPAERVKAMLAIVRDEFFSVKAMVIQTGVVGWPLAANLMFKAVARQIQEAYKLPFLWLESDAVPLQADWLDTLGEAYRRCPKPLMGCVLDAERAIEGLPNRYVAGVAIYPQDTFGMLATRWEDPKFKGMAKPPKLSTAAWQQNVRAWDMVFADVLVPRTHITPLIQNHWGLTYNEPPLFKTVRTEADPANTVTMDFIRRDALIFHRVKALADFLPMWKIRLEAETPYMATAVGPVAIAGVLPEAQPGPANPNFKGGDEKAKERRRAAAERSKQYLEEARAKRQQEQQAAMQAHQPPALV